MGLLISLKDWLKPAPPLDPQILKALSRVFSLVDPMLNTLPGIEKSLVPALLHTLDYCRQLVETLPGPFHVDEPSFATSPLIHALFPAAEDIAIMLAKSRTVREYLEADDGSGGEFIYAMLAARWKCKKSLGMAYDGRMLQSDALIEYLYFSDHVLVEPADNLASAHEKLRQVALDSLLKTFRIRLVALRDQRHGLQEQCRQERDQMNVMRSTGKPDKVEEHSRRLRAVEEQLRQNIEALRPENIIAPLADFLSAPEKALRLEKMSIAVDRTGIVIRDEAESDNTSVETLDFQQIIGRDRRKYIGMMVSIRREDVEAAVLRLKDMQQRYLII